MIWCWDAAVTAVILVESLYIHMYSLHAKNTI